MGGGLGNKHKENGRLQLTTSLDDLGKAIQDKPEFERMYRWSGLLDSESDRGTAVLAATVFEETLAKLLSGFMVEGADTKALLRFDGPLGSFGARTQLSYALGLISSNEVHDLLEIATIRNKFAHDFDADFTSQAVRDRCLRLKCSQAPRNKDVPAKMHFAGACLYLMMVLCKRVQKVTANRRSACLESAKWLEGPDCMEVVLIDDDR